VIAHLDLRRTALPDDVVRARYKHRGGVIVMRDPKTITGIVVHQTACTFGPSDDADRRHRRAQRIPAHATAFRDGTFVTPCDLPAYAQHGHRLNGRSLGLEIEGRYSGEVDDPATAPREDLGSTWGGPPDVVTDLVVECARVALKWLVDEGRRLGCPIKFVWAHRQSSATRRSDPGAELWRRVVLLYAIPALGLEAQPGLVVGDGRPIPRSWDLGSGVGRY